MTFGGPPKMPQRGAQGESSRMPVTLDALLSETPIHGLGYERFNAREKADLESALSRVGSSLDDPILAGLKGEDLQDIMTYVRSQPGTPEREGASQRIEAAIQRLRDEA